MWLNFSIFQTLIKQLLSSQWELRKYWKRNQTNVWFPALLKPTPTPPKSGAGTPSFSANQKHNLCMAYWHSSKRRRCRSANLSRRTSVRSRRQILKIRWKTMWKPTLFWWSKLGYWNRKNRYRLRIPARRTDCSWTTLRKSALNCKIKKPSPSKNCCSYKGRNRKSCSDHWLTEYELPILYLAVNDYHPIIVMITEFRR